MQFDYTYDLAGTEWGQYPGRKNYQSSIEYCSLGTVFLIVLQYSPNPCSKQLRPVYMFTSIHTYIHTQVHRYIDRWQISTSIHTLIPTYIHTYMHTQIHTYTHTYIHTYPYRHIYIGTNIHICIGMYICVYIYIQMYTCILHPSTLKGAKASNPTTPGVGTGRFPKPRFGVQLEHRCA